MPRAVQLAKLTRPRLYGAIARERLFDQLDRAREQHKSICVVGPPGAGKTTLVASWLDARGLPGIWYQVDAGDADLATLFYHLAEAAGPFSNSKQRRLPALTPEYLDDIAGFTRRFFRDLYARLPAQATLVLDNYQEATGATDFHRTVVDAIAEAPRSITVILVTRRDPPELYARLIANENFVFVGWEELRLGLDEAAAIASRRGHTDHALIRLVHGRTDGWAAGLTLFLEHAYELGIPSDVGSDAPQRVFDYFATQILAEFGDAVRNFLLATAWLPSVSVQLAEALTGNRKARSILEDLYGRHLFIHRRGGESPTYHYHALFRDFLRTQAQMRFSETALAALRANAATLVEAAGDVESAIDLYCTSADWSNAARLILARAPHLLAQGRWKTLQEWVARMPGAVVERTPWLQYWIGRSKLGVALADARLEMQYALDAFARGNDTVGQVLAIAGIMETHWLEWRAFGAIDPWLDRLVVLLETCPAFPDPESEMRAYSALLMGISHRQPRNPMLPAALGRTKALLQSDIDKDLKLASAGMLLAHSGCCLDIKLGEWTVAVVDVLAEDHRTSALARLMWLRRLTSHLVHQGDYERARHTLERAETLSDNEGLKPGLALLTWLAGHLGVVCGDLAMAERYATQLERGAAAERPLDLGILHNVRCMIALARGQSQAALDHGLHAVRIARTDLPVWTVPVFTLPAVYAMLETGEHVQAREHIETLHRFVERSSLAAYLADVWLAEAYLQLRYGTLGACHAALRNALQIAAERNYVFLFRTAFRPHRVVLTEAFRAGLDNDYLRRAVARFKLRPHDLAGQRWPWPVRLYTLGRFEIQLNDQTLVFGAKTPRRLMALLKVVVALGGREVPEQKLTELLWPDEEGDAAHHALTVALHRLRRVLGNPQAIRVEDGAVSLDPARVWVDALQLADLLTTGLEVTKTGDDRTLNDAAETVSALYQGSFLPADLDAPWSISLRERLRFAFVEFVVAHGIRLETAEHWQEAAQWYQRGLAADDLTESFYQGLMRCHLRSGAHAEGMSTFRRLRRTLSITLGIQPSAASEALFRAMQVR